MNRSVAGFRAVIVIGASLAALLGSATPVAAVTPFNSNLVKNPGAEGGPAGADGTEKVAIPAWKTATNSKMTVVRYGTPGGYPTLAESQRLHMGDKFFASGLETASHGCSGITQTIDVVGRNPAVDSNEVRMNFGVFIATFDSQTDSGFAKIVFINGANNVISTLTTASASKTNGVFQLRSVTTIVPRATRHIQVNLFASNSHQGAECDVWFDRVTLKLKPA